MFERIRPEFQCLEGEGQNSSVWKDTTRILRFGRVRSEFQCLEGLGQNSNVWKDKITS